MRKNCLLMCFVFLFLFPLLANAQFETINDVRYYYSKSKNAYEVVRIPSDKSPDFFPPVKGKDKKKAKLDDLIS